MMSRNIGWAILLAIFPARAMPPNPFLPQISPCEKLSGQLASWVLQGVVSSPASNIALMFNSQGKSLRIKTDSELLPGVHIENVAPGFVSARLDSTCQPSSYRWEIKGKTHAMDSGITSVAASALKHSGR